jgi:hypothetical protein
MSATCCSGISSSLDESILAREKLDAKLMCSAACGNIFAAAVPGLFAVARMRRLRFDAIQLRGSVAPYCKDEKRFQRNYLLRSRTGAAAV